MNGTIGIARTAASNGCVAYTTAANATNGVISSNGLLQKSYEQTKHSRQTYHSDSQQQGGSTSNNDNKTNGASIAKNAELAAKLVQQSDIVCFDVDSTVIREEGIDELADFCGKGVEVAHFTKEAMGGAITFQDALKIRLNIIKPSKSTITEFIKLHPSTLTNNVKTFIEQLKKNGKQVFLVSGGFHCLIDPVAAQLNIPTTHVFANKLMFYYNGDYAGFDTAQPTAKSGGKAEAIKLIKQKHPNALITMIGDGATDLEAVPPANYFIGFGGNVVRNEVHKRSQYYVTDFEQLL